MAWGTIASGAIGAIGGLIGGWQRHRTSKQNTDRQNRANRELAEYSYSKDLEMWHKQNAYNTPAEQMKRFTDAGLNPHLIYGQGTPGNSNSTPDYNAPKMEYNYAPKFDPDAMLQQYQNMATVQAQNDNLRAQNDNIKADTANKILQNPMLASEGTIKAVQASIAETLGKYQVTEGQQRIDQNAKNLIIQDLTTDLKNWEVQLKNKGVTPNDNYMFRQLAMSGRDMGLDLNDLQEMIKDLPRLRDLLKNMGSEINELFKNAIRSSNPFRNWENPFNR